jgi:MFS family permease
MPSRIRYKVLALALLLGAITYLDRMCISIMAPTISKELGLSKVQMGWVFAVFQFTYGAFAIPTGHWADKVGTRRVLTRIVVWWSSFTMLTAAAISYPVLLVIRFFFGIGEAGAWPNVARTFSRWFPLGERGTVQGIFFMGAHLSAALTPALVTYLAVYLHWRTMFLVFGSVGFVWALVWWRWFRDEPSQHSAVSPEELALIQRGRPPERHGEITSIRWTRLMSNPSVLGLCGMYFAQSYGFNFYATWLPTYLKTVRGIDDPFFFSLAAGLPMYCSVPADLFGGISADRMSRRYGPKLGRALVGGGSLFLSGLLLIAGVWVSNSYLAAILIGLAGGMSAFLLGAAWGTCMDIGGNHAGLVSAAMNTSGQVGAFLCPLVVGYFTGWSVPLYFTGVLYCLGALCWLKIDPTKPVWTAIRQPEKTQ